MTKVEEAIHDVEMRLSSEQRVKYFNALHEIAVDETGIDLRFNKYLLHLHGVLPDSENFYVGMNVMMRATPKQKAMALVEAIAGVDVS